MLEMLEAMFFCNSVAELASNMEITMLEMLEAIVFATLSQNSPSTTPGASKLGDIHNVGDVGGYFFFNAIAKLASNMQITMLQVFEEWRLGLLWGCSGAAVARRWR